MFVASPNWFSATLEKAAGETVSFDPTQDMISVCTNMESKAVKIWIDLEVVNFLILAFQRNLLFFAQWQFLFPNIKSFSTHGGVNINSCFWFP